ncbi:MFS transporter, partial [Microvirga massiliensis]|uniref:MFS transporter n=1 Tax=Microvirga massiliensis TaxID=1033741 RepID=UPI0006605526
LVLASYYGGYTLGAATIAGVLQRVGHIRLFAALAGLVAAAITLQPIFTSPGAWIGIRLLTGLGCAGLFITAESWLNAATVPQNRGFVFAIYMVAANAAFGLGQFLINLPAPGGYELFSLAAALFCLALIPVSLTRATAPKLPDTPPLRLRELRRIAPVALAGCAASGLTGSAFYSLVPAYAQAQGIPAASISAYVATAIFGGLAFQIPAGRLSDRYDRRLVAGAIATGLAATALCLAVLPQTSVVFGFTFVLGGFLSTIYPVCVAHANDRVAPDQVVSVSGQLILVYGLASFLGPIIGTSIMGAAGMRGVFVYMAAAAGAFVLAAVWRSLRVEAPERKARPFTILDQQISQQAAHRAGDGPSAGGRGV